MTASDPPTGAAGGEGLLQFRPHLPSWFRPSGVGCGQRPIVGMWFSSHSTIGQQMSTFRCLFGTTNHSIPRPNDCTAIVLFLFKISDT